ncbi:hypothetical protein [Proteus mirabilis]|uniref:hypothetical protein n=1 Tax=Proteus mirabilis TaxID=584 RepID=UPI0024E084CF|nr:hypothetical protein [Proteus mirabilis]
MKFLSKTLLTLFIFVSYQIPTFANRYIDYYDDGEVFSSGTNHFFGFIGMVFIYFVALFRVLKFGFIYSFILSIAICSVSYISGAALSDNDITKLFFLFPILTLVISFLLSIVKYIFNPEMESNHYKEVEIFCEISMPIIDYNHSVKSRNIWKNINILEQSEDGSNINMKIRYCPTLRVNGCENKDLNNWLLDNISDMGFSKSVKIISSTKVNTLSDYVKVEKKRM